MYDGAAPAPEPLKIDKDTEVCGKNNLVSETLVVGADGGLANVVVWVRSKVSKASEGEGPTTRWCSTTTTAISSRTWWESRSVRRWKSRTLRSPVAHNTKIDGLNLQVNPLIQAGTSFTQAIDAPETLPAMVSCSIHSWMNARLVIRPNPYFAISDAKGNFEIKNLPDGELEYQVWHERAGYVTKAEVAGQPVTWAKGRVKWIFPGRPGHDQAERRSVQ